MEEHPNPPRQAIEPTRTLPRPLRPDTVLGNVTAGVHHTSAYTTSILQPAIRLLRIPLIPIVFVFLLSLIITRISSTLSSAFSPFCHVPGISYTSMCRWVDRSGNEGSRQVQWADYQGLVKLQSKTFEQMVDESLHGPTTPSFLSLSFKKSEMATADLIGLVRLSDLRSRESLANALSGFANDAREASLSLARLDAKMNGALDSIAAVNDYALNRIGSARENQPSKLVSALAPWTQGKPVEEIVKQTFLDAMDILSENLERVVLEVMVNTQNLNALGEKLRTIQEIVSRDDKSVTEERDALTGNILGALWTKLGGNNKELRNFSRNLKLLNDVGSARELASARVVATLHSLQKADKGMQDMRERVAAPNLARSKIPPEVHMRIIRAGLDRLAEGRERAKALEQKAWRKVFTMDS